jgi:hypothetical protein
VSASAVTRERIVQAILERTAARGDGRTLCPSEVARALADDWRPLMPAVREVATDLADAGEVVVTQKGRPVDARTARGPVRLGRATGAERR